MCGRFVAYRNLESLLASFPIQEVKAEVSANYNVAPTQKVLAVIHQDGLNTLDRLYWGLIPFWAKDRSIGSRIIDARAETVDSKPAFRNAFKKRRCLVPADGFYEWRGEKGQKQPMFITLPDEAPFAFAGLWELWGNPGQVEETLASCTILTTDASPSIRAIHDRMPVILKSSVYLDWLNPQIEKIDLSLILQQGIQKDLKFRPVSKTVNSVGNNTAELIAGK